jgi:SAM-dependent methyltransferase
MAADSWDSWSAQYAARREIADRFGDVFALPLAKRPRSVLLEQLGDDARVLEVGAGDRRLQRVLEARQRNVVYRSLDVDPHGRHDFRDWSEVDEAFDLVFAFEVVEHVDVADLADLLANVKRALKPGGRLVLSTPNIYYPPAYLRDVTHRTPLCFDELGGLVERAGLRVTRLLRTYNDTLLRRLLKRYALGWLFRTLGIDFARQIVLVAENPAETRASRSAA